ELCKRTLGEVLPSRAGLAIGRALEAPAETVSTICQRKDGDLGLVDVRWTPVESDPALGLAIVRELPGPSAAEAELRDVNTFLDAVVENIPDMIFVKEAKTLLFERFNRAGEELLGWSRQELLGKTDHDFYPKEQADFFHLKDRETLR